MNVKVTIINTRCIIMPEAATVPSLTMMTSTGIACEGHTHTHTHTHTHRLRSSTLKFAIMLQTKKMPWQYPKNQYNYFHYVSIVS